MRYHSAPSSALAARAANLATEIDELSRAMEALVHLRRAQPAYAVGYEHGESSQLADWEFALMDVLPEEVEVLPSRVAEYVSHLRRASPP